MPSQPWVRRAKNFGGVSHLPEIASAKKTLSFPHPTLVARVVSGVYVVDYPRSHAVELHNRLTFDPNGMNHSSRPNAKGPDRQYLRVSDLGVLAHSELECALNDGYTLRFRMRVRWNMIAVRHTNSHYEHPFLPFNLCRRVNVRLHSRVLGGRKRGHKQTYIYERENTYFHNHYLVNGLISAISLDEKRRPRQNPG